MDARVEVVADGIGAVARRTVDAELRRLKGRTTLSDDDASVIAASLERMSAELVLEPIAAWQGDPRIVARLFGMAEESPVGRSDSEGDEPCPN